MKRKHKLLILALLGLGLLIAAGTFLLTRDIAVLHPAGVVAEKERNLMVIAATLAIFIVVPVFVLTFTIAWKYRAGNKKAKYTPDWDHNRAMETLWWVIPGVFILALSVI